MEMLPVIFYLALLAAMWIVALFYGLLILGRMPPKQKLPEMPPQTDDDVRKFSDQAFAFTDSLKAHKD